MFICLLCVTQPMVWYRFDIYHTSHSMIETQHTIQQTMYVCIVTWGSTQQHHPPPTITRNHPQPPPTTPGHPPPPTTTTHQPPVTPNHPRSPPITPDHPRSPPITPDHHPLRARAHSLGCAEVIRASMCRTLSTHQVGRHTGLLSIGRLTQYHMVLGPSPPIHMV